MLDQLSRFNDIIFEPVAHTYHLDGVRFTSATTFLHKFTSFDANKISLRMAKGCPVAAAELRVEWASKGAIACQRGTHVHEYLENKVNGVEAPKFDDAADLYYAADRFLADTKDKIDFVAQEFRLYDVEWGVCGTVDLLVWNKRYSQYEIWDYKTNKEIANINKYGGKLKAPLNKLDDCNYNIYSLQLSLYRLMIERNTNIKIGKCRLVHIAEDGYKVLNCLDLRDELIKILGSKK